LGGRYINASGALRSEIANARLHVIARSEATKQSTLSFRDEMDCFAELAMTALQPNFRGCLKIESVICTPP
jgi:hypothetical protein